MNALTIRWNVSRGYTVRRCRLCRNEWDRKRRAAKQQGSRGPYRLKGGKVCRNGHLITAENTYARQMPNGKMAVKCKLCIKVATYLNYRPAKTRYAKVDPALEQH